MPFPLALAVCENDLMRDLTFLKIFAGMKVDLRVTPLRGGRLDAKVTRLLKRQIDAATKAGLKPLAIVIHHDADRASAKGRRLVIERWFKRSGLGGHGRRLIVCSPLPCIERWLCVSLDVPFKGARPSDGCEPWKAAWGRGKEPDLDRVGEAAERARDKLAGLDDFDAFFRDWKRAGMEPPQTGSP